MNEDIIGKKFGKLTVIRLAEIKIINNRKRTFYECKCECGNIVIRNKDKLKEGRMSSCGCYPTGKMLAKHGLWSYDNKLYGVWQTMKARCFRKTCQKYKDYGARNITVCEEWKNDFKAFNDWAITNGYKEGLTIERIDVNGNYEPSNCKWITREEQAKNKRSNIFIEFNNETHCLKEWARILNLNYKALHSRLKNGWSVEKAFSTPTKTENRDIGFWDINKNYIEDYQEITDLD